MLFFLSLVAVGDLTFDSVEDLFCTSLLDDFFLGLATSFPLADFDLILVTWESELFFLIFSALFVFMISVQSYLNA